MLLSTTNGGWYRAGLLLALCCSLFAASPRCVAQNLVPNPSFELKDTCPYTIGFQEGDKPLFWEKWNQSPEYFNACVPGTGMDSLVGVPLNGFGFQHALEGGAYIGMYTYGSVGLNQPFREYVGCQLLEPLEVGETYNLSFYTNVAFGGSYWAPTWACNNMGMLFTMQPNVWTDTDQPEFGLRNHAHLHSTTVISDTANWTLVSGSFVADSAYQYLVLGNFFSDGLTDTLHIIPGNSLGAYYFMDGVCVTRAGQGCSFTSGIADQVPLAGRTWPNPVADMLHVRVDEGTQWQVYDASGRLVHDGVCSGDLLTIPVREWPLGEYVLRLKDKGVKHVRFVVMR
ncbi:MAG: T9SS type A sorting domain-containing protein [Bacteroidetes bacterium]|nr:T9SS type A sorting domain-containing protein [Bacteroidota bacterium]